MILIYVATNHVNEFSITINNDNLVGSSWILDVAQRVLLLLEQAYGLLMWSCGGGLGAEPPDACGHHVGEPCSSVILKAPTGVTASRRGRWWTGSKPTSNSRRTTWWRPRKTPSRRWRIRRRRARYESDMNDENSQSVTLKLTGTLLMLPGLSLSPCRRRFGSPCAWPSSSSSWSSHLRPPSALKLPVWVLGSFSASWVQESLLM